MRKEELVCPSGSPAHPEHLWEDEAREPKGSTKKSIETLQGSRNPDTKFEGDAAAQNVRDGDLTIPKRDRTSKVSRDPTEEEEDKGDKGDDHKVFQHCSREGCKHKAEIDHKTDTGNAEVKNVDRFDSFKQMRRNATIQKQTGATLTYKINGNKDADYVQAQIEYAAKVKGMRVVVKKIFT